MSLKAKVRKWLGLDDLPSVEMYLAHEKAARERHKATMQMLNEIRAHQLRVQGTVRTTNYPATDWDAATFKNMLEMQDVDK